MHMYRHRPYNDLLPEVETEYSIINFIMNEVCESEVAGAGL